MDQLPLQTALDKVKTRAREIIEHAQTMLQESSAAFFTSDANKAKNVIHALEKRMNELDVIVEELCIETIAVHQVQARNLRFLIMMIKINTELERIGDLALSISSYTIEILNARTDQTKPFSVPPSLKNIAEETLALHALTSEAFLEENPEKAIAVIESDRNVNALRDQAIGDLFAISQKDEVDINLLYALIRITQRFERVGDHCKNIAEEILYIVEGNIYKH